MTKIPPGVYKAISQFTNKNEQYFLITEGTYKGEKIEFEFIKSIGYYRNKQEREVTV